MDDTDLALIAALRADGRRSISDLALDLKLSRATVRARLSRLVESGEIQGFTAVLRNEGQDLPIRAMMMLAIEGKRADAVIRRLSGMPEARSIHTTNGRWDLVIELATPDLASFDAALHRIRLIEGVSATETSLMLSAVKTWRR
ncbi:Lrp/AsnC family transcriptional regulator [Pannonibacter sp. Q-1]|uniref:AsnC family transcriptional regulator n=1 Tax=Pannonibacter phragmitetus TaxID=121719 RepID=A0A0L0J6Z6_9HYPH|nr:MULTISPECIES: Lrp/AsnC family transcriptional regulator [Pannonibacter]ALV30320.1 AsnC family transcriptional regulator [Pannonibacter phragmitetus]KND21482.1 AsnC family transcriptional regulator [Pannonibacter phragmitetus]